MTGAVGVMSQLKPRFADIGFDGMTAMLLMTSTAFVATIGKYTWGMLCDRFEPRHVAAVLAGVNALGLVPSLFHDAILAVVLFILIFGFAMGGIMSTYPIIVADLFGRMSFPAVSRFMTLFLILQMSGYIVAGQSYDLLGSYDAAYGLYILFDLVAVCLLVTIRRLRVVAGGHWEVGSGNDAQDYWHRHYQMPMLRKRNHAKNYRNTKRNRCQCLQLDKTAGIAECGVIDGGRQE